MYKGKSIACVIPARMSSSRFPGKPLVKIHGREMVLRVADIAKKCKYFDRIIIATEDSEIREKFNDEIIEQEKKIDLDEYYPFDKTGNSRLGRCSKCQKTTFGNKFTIHKDDSDCCNAKINKYR